MQTYQSKCLLPILIKKDHLSFIVVIYRMEHNGELGCTDFRLLNRKNCNDTL
ncbi:uncharacterized protein PHALS_12368 [Plasmopara halstedii]|uniref:Uncharacterized protein n=1 Tax=Plasmopara halstedii TaxID=4781 RepID=A0A0P1ALM4_PLAHL|nr:uncharacterized protein PHALS_12368 [Plasmopara halstedii]CEG42062.1 hypothetical protein PHALS_12368 [Plasmopara halstedii]|eukprot:XP_024578431.1 hypothetical protein PHALS_12368 [Plasmopara halstedii]